MLAVAEDVVPVFNVDFESPSLGGFTQSPGGLLRLGVANRSEQDQRQRAAGGPQHQHVSRWVSAFHEGHCMMKKGERD